MVLQGVDRNVDEKKLKKAYRKLSLKYHPDKCKKPDCQQRFLDVSNGEFSYGLPPVIGISCSLSPLSHSI